MADEEAIMDPGQDVLFQSNVRVVSDTLLGKRKRLTGLNGWELAFLIVSVANIAACIALSVWRLVDVLKWDNTSTDFTFTILLIINSAFCIFYVVHGLLKELRYEICVFILATLVVFSYCILEYSINSYKRSYSKLIRLIVACVVAPINIALAVKVAYDFGWLEFRILGASEAMLDLYRDACWFLSLIKFDLQVAVSFLVLVLKNGTEKQGREVILVLSIGLTVSVVWSIFGAVLVKRESKRSAWLFALIGLAAPAYVLFKVVRAYTKYVPYFASDEELKPMLLYSTLFIGALFITIRSMVYMELIRIYRNFGRGLRPRAFEADERSGLLFR